MPHILVVDDEPHIRRLIEINLRRAGYGEVRGAENGQVALSMIGHSKPALIILDIEMPYTNGLEVLSQLESNPKTKDIPVIVLSIHSKRGDIGRQIDRAYIDKPFNPAELLSQIQQILEPAN